MGVVFKTSLWIVIGIVLIALFYCFSAFIWAWVALTNTK